MIRLVAPLCLALLAVPALAQTATDDSASTENWWDRVGAAFFSDESLKTMRPDTEIRAQWTGLSEDDQAAVRARCVELGDAAVNAKPPADGVLVESHTGTDAETTAAIDDGGGTTGGSAYATPGQEQVAGADAKTEAGTPDAVGAQTTTTGEAGGAENQTTLETTAANTGHGDSDESLTPICAIIMNF